MMSRKFLIVLFLMYSAVLFAQNKPYWLEEGGLPQSDYFFYYIGYGEQQNLRDAKKQAVQDVLQKISDKEGLDYKITGEQELKGSETQRNGDFDTHISFNFSTKVEKNGKEVILPSLQEASDYYLTENRGALVYKCWVLVRVPKQKAYANKPMYEPWGMAPVLRSAIVPGWGQIYKGNYSKKERRKGFNLLITETLLVAGVAGSQVMYNYNHDLAYETTSISQRDTYLANRDTWHNIQMGCAIGAGVVYLYTIIDAAANKKAKRYAYNENKVKLLPLMADNYYALGLSISLN